MATSPVEIQKHMREYLVVFAALACLTVVTVAISYLHVEHNLAIALALFVATVKGGLVCCFFMHLISERQAIYAICGLAVFFFLALLYLPLSNVHNHLAGTVDTSYEYMLQHKPANAAHHAAQGDVPEAHESAVHH